MLKYECTNFMVNYIVIYKYKIYMYNVHIIRVKYVLNHYIIIMQYKYYRIYIIQGGPKKIIYRQFCFNKYVTMK